LIEQYEKKTNEKNMKKNIAVIAVIGLIALAGVAAWYLMNLSESYSGTAEPIILGGLVSDANTMLFIAEDQHFFATNGIKFTLKTYDTGLATIDDLLKGKLDIAGAAEYPVVAKAFQKDNISIIASISKSDIVYLVGLTNRGIRNISDLKGKKIGIPRRTVLEFYLGRFLDLHGMSIRDVTLIDLPQGQTTDAIADGSVDAIVTREPYFSQVQKQQANGIVSWSVQSNQAVYSVLICRNDWIKEHPELIRRFLNSLAEAEEYIVQHPSEAKAILQARYHYDDEYVARVWPENQFSLSLDQSLITAMEDEGRWMIANNMANASNVPDLRNYVYKDGLEAVRPGSVNIIG
jgi:NitT/TauT family transport system substrate-binding protein